MAQLTAFGIQVRKRLLDLGRSQSWLIRQVNANTGLYVDGGYLYKVLTGQRTAPKIVNAICGVLGIREVE